MRERLRAARQKAGLTQEQMAAKLGFKSKSAYCMIERGQRGVTIEVALKIADILGKPVDDLFSALEVHVTQTHIHPIDRESA